MTAPFRFSASSLRHRTRLACGLIPLLNCLRDRGVSPETVLQPAGIRRFELIDPAFTIRFAEEIAIVEQALAYLPEPTAALDLARYYHLHNFSVLGLAIRACDTLGDVFELITRYPRLVWGVCETTGRLDGEVVNFDLRAGESRVERFLLERDMACVKTVFSEVLNDDLVLLDVRFAHAAPDNPAAYEAFFQCPVRFGAETSGLRFPVSELERPVPTADPLSREFYEAQCARLSAMIDEPFRYASLVRDRLFCTTPIPALEQLAEQLTIEPRTLQRYLKREGETFSAILRDVRLKRAVDRLRDPRLSLEAIAGELGFSDAVAFSHAFKQWTGVSPRQWRTEHA